jgi:DNA-binding beta-propeller fold protein YncE
MGMPVITSIHPHMNITKTNRPSHKFARLTALATTFTLALALESAVAAKPTPPPAYTTSVIARGLQRPTGIVSSVNEEIYFSEVPSPGVPNAGNAVKRLDLEGNEIVTVHEGEPEPTNLALDHCDTLYWTCKSAGVILRMNADGTASPLLQNLQKPSGIALDRKGNVYFTEIPTPGVPGPAGGTNRVSAFDGSGIEVLTTGEPEPTDIASNRRGEIYWTCKSAGVILTQDIHGKTTTLLSGLPKPTGIALNHKGTKLFWTEVPTPGVGGANGGTNKVWELNLKTKVRTLVNNGDPEPTDVTVDRDGSVYWTCTSAGVIVKAMPTPRHRSRD